MKIYLTIKPILWRAKDKPSLERQIRTANWEKVVRDGVQIGINYEKRNPVYRQTKFKNGKTKKTELVRPGCWLAYTYYFEKHLPVKIVQHARHFTITQTRR